MHLGHAFPLASALKTGAVFVAGAYLLMNSKKRRSQYSDDEKAEINKGIDLEILEAAERAQMKTIEEQRRSLGPKYSLWNRISSQAVSEKRINEWAREAKAAGISVKILFEAAFSPRAGRFMRTEGSFEIYVHEKDRERLDQFEKRP